MNALIKMTVVISKTVINPISKVIRFLSKAQDLGNCWPDWVILFRQTLLLFWDGFMPFY